MGGLKRLPARRVAAIVVAAWAGMLLCLALVATPAGFALLPKESAGRLAGHMLTREAFTSVILCSLLFPWLRRQARDLAAAGRGSVLSPEVLLVLGVLFCTVFGHFALRPAMEAARAGQGIWSFGALHGLSAACFGLKILLVATLAWRFSAPESKPGAA